MAEKIKYIVKCPYCDKSYTMETKHGEDFCCPTCGGAGTLKDAIKVEEKPEVIVQRVAYVGNNRKLKKPDWYGEDKPLPPVEEKTFVDHLVGEDASKGEGTVAIIVIAIVTLLGWILGM